MSINIDYVKKLGVLGTKKKRVKIIVGGRASTKSTFVSDYVLAKVSHGETWCCGREFQNSIDDSVHSMLEGEIERCEFNGFVVGAAKISHVNGGSIFYKGLARNITSLKGLNRLNGLWIEEGESLSAATLKVLTASVRLSAAEAKKQREAGKLLEVPEIWITMNRGSSKDPVSQKFLARAEKELARRGYYEDDNIMIVQINYTDIPKQWFLDSGLESERLDDKKNMTTAEYDHKWGGAYSDTVENAIIQAEWFDACIDAHKNLGFEPLGQIKVTYDPADSGDAKAVCYSHGSVIMDIVQKDTGLIDTATDWACSYANDKRPDVFSWDADGMGMGLKRQIADAFNGKKVTVEAFRGSEGCDNPKQVYDSDVKVKDQKINKEMFANKRAQYYWALRERMRKTYMAVKGKSLLGIKPDELISFSSSIKDMAQLRSEVCRVPRKYKASGRIQLMTKQEMKNLGIDSPNMADALMMSCRTVDTIKKHVPLKYETLL